MSTHSGSDEEVRREMERTRNEATQLASGAAEEAKDRGRDAADQAKDQAADHADRLASALETTAEDLESSETREGETLSGYGRSMAEMMRRFAGGLRERDIEEFAGELAGFARRNPASFLAGSVALGFGVSRFLKASSTRPHEDYGYEDEDEELLFGADDEELGLEEQRAASEGAAPSPGVGPAAGATGTGAWPRDRGEERPGAASAGEQWTPVVSSEPPETRSDPLSAGGSERAEEPSSERIQTRSKDEIRRNEP